jgi:basic amino acid/polyamine antiporter, APA family
MGIEDCNPMAFLFTVVICVLNTRSTETSAYINSILTAAKLVVLFFIIIVAFTKFDSSNFAEDKFVTPKYGYRGTLFGCTMLFFAMIGFDIVSTIAEEAKNAQVDAPAAMRETVVICSVMYAVISIAFCGMGLGP